MGCDAALQFIDAVKNFGYEVATKSGLSFSIDDFDLEGRDSIIEEAEKECGRLQKRYDNGKIMEYERYNYSIDAWSKAADKLKTLILKQDTPLVWTMQSGARGKIDQVIQVSGMKGLVSEPVSGKVIEIPVKNSFRQGLTPLEYFMSIHGARKGLIDKGMKTAESGYLTRRLVDVSHGIFIVEEDCGTTRGLKRSVDDRSIVGQTLAEDVDSIGCIGDIITDTTVKALKVAGHVMPLVRSPLTCESKNGICQKCYGLDLSTKKSVLMGMPVGIIAAQSIGEPGTQMVLRSFHTGGAASLVLTESNVMAAIDGQVKLEKLTLVQRSDGKTVTLTDGKITLGELTYDVPRSSVVGVIEDSHVIVGDLLYSYYPYNYELVASRGGIVKFIDLEIGRTVEETPDNFGRKNLQVAYRSGHAPSIQILVDGAVIDTVYIPEGAYLIVNNGDTVKAGDTVARLPKSLVKAIDITSGLKDINRLFEARSPQPPSVPAVLSDISGMVSIEHRKGCRYVYVNGGAGMLKEYKVGYAKLCLVNDGDWIVVGTKISEGDIDPQDILRVWGFIGAQEYMVEKIAEVYDFHGIFISKKHIEIIVRQMFSKVRITEPGNSDFITDEVADRAMVLEVNEELMEENKVPIQYELILLGISKVAMASSSFLSAISFQNTIRLMTDAALYGRRDRFCGMKENVLVGKQIPVSILDMNGVKNEEIV
jgi:DNA-directed RNA polymerase subunit beta'